MSVSAGIESSASAHLSQGLVGTKGQGSTVAAGWAGSFASSLNPSSAAGAQNFRSNWQSLLAGMENSTGPLGQDEVSANGSEAGADLSKDAAPASASMAVLTASLPAMKTTSSIGASSTPATSSNTAVAAAKISSRITSETTDEALVGVTAKEVDKSASVESTTERSSTTASPSKDTHPSKSSKSSDGTDAAQSQIVVVADQTLAAPVVLLQATPINTRTASTSTENVAGNASSGTSSFVSEMASRESILHSVENINAATASSPAAVSQGTANFIPISSPIGSAATIPPSSSNSAVLLVKPQDNTSEQKASISNVPPSISNQTTALKEAAGTPQATTIQQAPTVQQASAASPEIQQVTNALPSSVAPPVQAETLSSPLPTDKSNLNANAPAPAPIALTATPTNSTSTASVLRHDAFGMSVVKTLNAASQATASNLSAVNAEASVQVRLSDPPVDSEAIASPVSTNSFAMREAGTVPAVSQADESTQNVVRSKESPQAGLMFTQVESEAIASPVPSNSSGFNEVGTGPAVPQADGSTQNAVRSKESPQAGLMFNPVESEAIASPVFTNSLGFNEAGTESALSQADASTLSAAPPEAATLAGFAAPPVDSVKLPMTFGTGSSAWGASTGSTSAVPEEDNATAPADKGTSAQTQASASGIVSTIESLAPLVSVPVRADSKSQNSNPSADPIAIQVSPGDSENDGASEFGASIAASDSFVVSSHSPATALSGLDSSKYDRPIIAGTIPAKAPTVFASQTLSPAKRDLSSTVSLSEPTGTELPAQVITPATPAPSPSPDSLVLTAMASQIVVPTAATSSANTGSSVTSTDQKHKPVSSRIETGSPVKATSLRGGTRGAVLPEVPPPSLTSDAVPTVSAVASRVNPTSVQGSLPSEHSTLHRSQNEGSAVSPSAVMVPMPASGSDSLSSYAVSNAAAQQGSPSALPTSTTSGSLGNTRSGAQGAVRAVHGSGKIESATTQGNVATPGGVSPDASTLVRDPSAERGTSTAKVETEAASLKGSTAHETLAGLDAASAAPTPTWVHAGAQHAEVGYHDPELGWVAVRADSSGGSVHASIIPGSADAAQALSGHLEGLNSFLAEHHTSVDTVTMGSPESRSASLDSERGSSQNMQQGPGQEAGQGSSADRQSSQPVSNSNSTSNFFPTSSASSDATAQAVGIGGGHISVMA